MKVVFGNSDTWNGHNWKMEVDLSVICKLEGKKEDVTAYGDNKRRYVVSYPKSKVRKLFKLMVHNIHNDSTLDEIQNYLKGHSKWYEKLFYEIRQKNGR